MRRQIKPFTVERKRGGRPVGTDAVTVLDLPRPEPEVAEVQKSYAPRWAAAEALFSTPKPDKVEKAPGEESSTDRPGSSGRILPNLLEPPAPPPSFELEEPPVRRGRKPGSRNKTPRTPRDEQGPKTIDAVMRSVFTFWAREAEEDAPEAPAHVEPAAPIAPLGSVAAPPLQLRRRGRLARAELPRGHRWKARLPRFAR
jgi:hypothetical protein